MPRYTSKPLGIESPAAQEVLTIREVAAILKLAGKTVYAMANAHELPAFKVRGLWRIRKVDLQHWMTEQAHAAAHQRQNK